MTAVKIRGIMILWLAMVVAAVVLSLMPFAAPPGQLGADKVVHFLAFLGLAAIPVAVLPRFSITCLAILLLLAVGAGIELAQARIPGRHGSGADMLANVAGVALGMAIGRLGLTLARRTGARRIGAGRAGPSGAAMSTRTVVPRPQEQGK